MLENQSYRRVITACNNLMANTKLSLYEEVEMLRRGAQKSPNNGAVLQKLDSDLSFLIERLSSAEKVSYVQCCENVKATSAWELTEP